MENRRRGRTGSKHVVRSKPSLTARRFASFEALPLGPAHGILPPTPRENCPPMCYPHCRDKGSRPKLAQGYAECTLLIWCCPTALTQNERAGTIPVGLKSSATGTKCQHKKKKLLLHRIPFLDAHFAGAGDGDHILQTLCSVHLVQTSE